MKASLKDTVTVVFTYANDHPLCATINNTRISAGNICYEDHILISLRLLTKLLSIPHFLSSVCAIVQSTSTHYFEAI